MHNIMQIFSIVKHYHLVCPYYIVSLFLPASFDWREAEMGGKEPSTLMSCCLYHVYIIVV